MAKRRHSFDEGKLARFLKEGRGQGTGGSYKPWLTIQDVPSKGRTARPTGWKTGRLHQLLSNIEAAAYYTVGGSRHTITYADAPVTAGVWHQLRVDFKGAYVVGALDGKRYIEADDNHIPSAGRAGVWAKANSVTLPVG